MSKLSVRVNIPLQRLSIQKTDRSSLVLSILLLAGLALFLGAATARPVQATPAAQPEHVQNLMQKAQSDGHVRVIVQLNVAFRPEGDLEQPQLVQSQQQAIDSVQGSVLQKMAGTNTSLIADFSTIPYLALVVDAAALATLAGLPELVGIQEDVPVPPDLASGVAAIGAEQAWAAGYTGEGQAVAILDTGVDESHPFFSVPNNKIVAEACYSTAVSGTGVSSLCPGGAAQSTASGSGRHCDTGIGGCGHGTHVAGIAAANDGATNLGVAPDARIIAIQIFSRFDDGSGASQCASFGLASPCALTYTSDQIKGLEYVYTLRHQFDIAAVNMSLGGGRYFVTCDNDARKAVIDNLRSAGIATIVASGNAGYRDSMAAPACISSAVSVGATMNSDSVAYFSNVAPFIDLLAPGLAIVSSVPGGGTAAYSGTSMAAPHVAGAWAVYRQMAPEATVAETLAVFQNTGVAVNDTRPGGLVTGMRRIDLSTMGASIVADYNVYVPLVIR
jgi:hypothetical protein